MRVPITRAVPTLEAHQARITCRSCNLALVVEVPRPALLCDLCTLDLVATEAHVVSARDGAIAAYNTAKAHLEALVQAADADTRTRYRAVEDALYACLGLPNDKLQRRLDNTITAGDALSAIVAADLELLRLANWRFTQEDWARKALREIDVWRNGDEVV